MQQTFLARVVLPAVLFFIMLGMGLSLVGDDFRRVLRTPKAALVGVACQMLLLPLVGLALVAVLDFEDPALAVGLMVLTFCPGGVASNMLTHLARGDVALSVSLTAVVSLFAPFTIPLLAASTAQHLMGDRLEVVVPLGSTIVALLVITVVPVGLGMLVNHRRPAVARRLDKPVKVLSVVFLLAIIAALVRENAAMLPTFIRHTGPAAVILNVTTMALGFGVARLAGLSRPQRSAVAIEVGMQNGTTALMVTGTLIGNATMTFAPAIYSLIQFVTGGIFAAVMAWRPEPAELAASDSTSDA